MEHDIAARARRGHIVLTTVVAVWGLGVATAAKTGLFSGVYPLLLAGLIALGIILPVVAYALSRSFRDYIEALGLYGLTAFHVWRIVAALVFFWYGAHNLLPDVFVQNARWVT
jgi:hypothetical protein